MNDTGIPEIDDLVALMQRQRRRDQVMTGLMAATALALIAFGMAVLATGCGTESADSAQVAAATPTAVVQPAELNEPGHTQMSDEYTVAKSPDEVCVVSLRSDCAPWGAWATPPATPVVPWRDNRTPVAAVTPCGGGGGE